MPHCIPGQYSQCHQVLVAFPGQHKAASGIQDSIVAGSESGSELELSKYFGSELELRHHCQGSNLRHGKVPWGSIQNIV